MVVVGIAILRIVPFGFGATGEDTAGHDGPTDVAPRRLGLAFRRAWAPVIAVDLLFIVHWGVVVAFLPQRAEAAGANIGLFFVADGLAILLVRVPSGWLADRIRPLALVLVGLLATGCAIVVLTRSPTTPLLVLAGCLTGVGGGLVITPLLVELSRRSRDADRGSAFSMFSAANATALAIGSIGGALIVERFGFETAMLATLVGVVAAAALATADSGLRRQPRAIPVSASTIPG